MEQQAFILPFYLGDQANDEQRTASLNLITKCFDLIEGRFSDNRKYCAGDQLTAADFGLLGLNVGFFSNPNLKTPAFGESIRAELDKRPNVKRVMANLRGEKGLDAYINSTWEKKWDH